MEKGPGNEGTGTGEMKCSVNDISEQSEKIPQITESLIYLAFTQD